MDHAITVVLPDGAVALVLRSMTWGEIVQIWLLAIIVWLELYRLWRGR